MPVCVTAQLGLENSLKTVNTVVIVCWITVGHTNVFGYQICTSPGLSLVKSENAAIDGPEV